MTRVHGIAASATDVVKHIGTFCGLLGFADPLHPEKPDEWRSQQSFSATTKLQAVDPSRGSEVTCERCRATVEFARVANLRPQP